MSYQIFVQKFEYGDSAPIPFEQLLDVLSKYGSVEDGHFGLEFVSAVGDICDHAPISGKSKAEITGISFDRPTLHEQLPHLIFDLLSIENTCFFGPDLEYMQSRSEMRQHLPDVLKEHFPHGPEIIKDPLESWPLK